MTFRLDRQGRVEPLKVLSSTRSRWAEETASRMLRATTFPPIPEEVIAEQGRDWVDVEAETSISLSH